MEGKYFPLFMDISEKNIVVAGGGRIALRRIRVLMEFCRNIRVIAPEVLEEIQYLQGVQAEIREIVQSDVDDADMVLILTNDAGKNDEISEWCRKRDILVNHGGEREKCDFYFPGIVNRDGITVGITANGRDHRLAKEMTKYIGKCLDNHDK